MVPVQSSDAVADAPKDAGAAVAPKWLRIGAVAVFCTVFFAVALTASDVGLTWDEPAYLHSARGDLPAVPGTNAAQPTPQHVRCGVLQWFGRLLRCRGMAEVRDVTSKRAILEAWDYNRYGPNFHPPLSGLIAALLHCATPFLDEIASWRVASAFEFALATSALFWFLGSRYGPWTGFAAALALVSMPRVVGDAHLFGTDMPVMAVWACTALAFWKGLEHTAWRLAFGALLGVCFVTKFTAMLVVVPLALWLLAYRAWPYSRAKWLTTVVATAWIAWPLALGGFEIARLAHAIRTTTQSRLSASGAPAMALANWIGYVDVRDLGVSSAVPNWILFLPLALWLLWCALQRIPAAPQSVRDSGAGLRLWLAGLGLAPAVAIALNPTWWHDTLPQLGHYYQITAGRHGALPDIEIFYLGRKFIYSLPWHNGVVLLAVTIPTIVAGLFAAGLIRSVWLWRRDSLRLYFVLHMLTLPVFRMLPTPAHDGVRLMLPAFFFVAGIAGWGFGLIVRLAERLRVEDYSVHTVPAVASVLLFASPLYWLWQSHPFELSYYSGLIGGLPGAHRIGFEPTYWYDAVTPDVLAALNDVERGVPRGGVLHPPNPRCLAPVFDELQRLRRLRPDIELGANPDGFPFMHLLTHSSKASAFTRVLYALEPRYSSGPRGVRLFSLYDPVAVSRGFALTLFLDGGPSGATRPLRHRLHREMLELAQRQPHSVEIAATLLNEVGLSEAQARARGREPGAAVVLDWLAQRPDDLQQLLSRRPRAIVEAAEILNRAAASRPQLLRLLIEEDGYAPAEKLGEYLDAFLGDVRDFLN